MSSDGQICFAVSMNHASIILKPRNNAMESVGKTVWRCQRKIGDCFSIDNPPSWQAANK